MARVLIVNPEYEHTCDSSVSPITLALWAWPRVRLVAGNRIHRIRFEGAIQGFPVSADRGVSDVHLGVVIRFGVRVRRTPR